MGAGRILEFLVPLFLLILISVGPVHAASEFSMPTIGRYNVLTVRVFIPSTPRWAHDVVLDAMLAWNRAQVVYAEGSRRATVYSFVESDQASATSVVSFSMPAAYASIAVGWTMYRFAVGSRSTFISTRTYLTPSIFGVGEGGNVTAVRYAFWLALHELGRVLGLGSVLDGKDIMEPRFFAGRVDEVPEISTLDLYALHVLAGGVAPGFVSLPGGVQDQFTPVTTYLPSLNVMGQTP